MRARRGEHEGGGTHEANLRAHQIALDRGMAEGVDLPADSRHDAQLLCQKPMAERGLCMPTQQQEFSAGIRST
jgi:hypothetical protein